MTSEEQSAWGGLWREAKGLLRARVSLWCLRVATAREAFEAEREAAELRAALAGVMPLVRAAAAFESAHVVFASTRAAGWGAAGEFAVDMADVAREGLIERVAAAKGSGAIARAEAQLKRARIEESDDG